MKYAVVGALLLVGDTILSLAALSIMSFFVIADLLTAAGKGGVL